jgi:hypothetical protein
VYCRRDGYDPIVCPNPFSLGNSTPLGIGAHTAEFFLDTGAGIDATKPAVSYSWNIVASAGSDPTPAAPAPTASKLTKLAPYAWDANATTGTYMSDLTLPALGADGAVAFDMNVKDPAGGANKVNFHRVRQGYAARVGGNRSEFALVNGFIEQDTSYWMAFAIYMPSTWGTTAVSGDRQTFWQIHANNEFSPSLSLQFNGDDGKLRWLTCGDGYPDDQQLQVDSTATPRNVWIKYIVHHKKSFSGAPLLEIWRGQGSGPVAYTKIVNRTTPFGYNLPGLPDWEKQGIYKWTMNAYGANPDRSIYTYGEFHQKGENLYDNAVAALADL